MTNALRSEPLTDYNKSKSLKEVTETNANTLLQSQTLSVEIMLH